MLTLLLFLTFNTRVSGFAHITIISGKILNKNRVVQVLNLVRLLVFLFIPTTTTTVNTSIALRVFQCLFVAMGKHMRLREREKEGAG